MLDRAKAFARRYGDADWPAPDVWNDVLDVQFRHRSVRHYMSKALAPGTLELIVGAAQSSASSSNLQFWSVVAVENAARRAAFAELAGNQAFVATAPLLLIFLADMSRAERIARARGVDPEAIGYFEMALIATIDAALAAQNAALAAESIGLGTCYVGAIRNRIEDVARELRLPARVYPVFGLVVGHPDPSIMTDVKPRLPQSAVLHREVYGAPDEPVSVAAYNGRMHRFQEKQRLPRLDWTRQVSDRIATKAGLKGREGLRQALEAFGFGLK